MRLSLSLYLPGSVFVDFYFGFNFNLDLTGVTAGLSVDGALFFPFQPFIFGCIGYRSGESRISGACLHTKQTDDKRLNVNTWDTAYRIRSSPHASSRPSLR